MSKSVEFDRCADQWVAVRDAKRGVGFAVAKWRLKCSYVNSLQLFSCPVQV
jgi:hypothetical protein